MLVLVDLIVGQVVTLFLVYKEAESDIYIYEIIHNNFPLFSFSLSLYVWFHHCSSFKLVSNFNTLFISARSRNLYPIKGMVERHVTEDMNNKLLQDFKALKQMHPNTSPSPDNMSPFFSQKYWPIIGNSISPTVLETLNFGHFPNEFNYTNIVLIPKTKNPKLIQEFSPISLCNVIYLWF